jgi:ATP-dependent helicase HrpB
MRLPLWAYPDRVCRRRGSDAATGAMVGGGGVRLAPESVVRQHEFYLALDARQDQRNLSREAIVHVAHAVEPDWLEQMFPQEIRHERSAVYDPQRQRVIGRAATYYRDLPLREQITGDVDPAAAEAALREALAPRAAEIVAQDEAVTGLLRRIDFLARLGVLSGVSVASPEDLVAEACVGATSLADVKRNLRPVLDAALTHDVRRKLDQHAPEAIEVPTGNRIRLDWSTAAVEPQVLGPVLAVRLQELFGMTETPRVAAGRVPVRLHLLGPNFRPVQVTDDLRSFWSTTYFQVRKDLRVRYPKHAWPEDPLTAKPEAKGGRRR